MHSNSTNNVNVSLAKFLHSASFLKRTLTVFILAPLGIWLLILGYPYSLGLFGILYVGLLVEWFWLVGHSKKLLMDKIYWCTSAILYISGGVWGFYFFYYHAPLKGLVLLFVIWATDIGAYLVGSFLGGPKVWPRISPNKTWSGAIGGTTAALCVVFIAAVFNESFRTLPLFLFYIAMSIVGQLGDLLESLVKRRFQVKDSGALLPGHGGLLDRFDSTLAIGNALWFLWEWMNIV